MKSAFLMLAASLIFIAGSSLKSGQRVYDETKRKKITTDILNNLIKEDYEAVRAEFHSSLKEILPAEKISEAWNATISRSGPYKKIISTSVGNFQGYNQVKLRLQFENENATLEATFTDDDKVLGLFIKP